MAKIKILGINSIFLGKSELGAINLCISCNLKLHNVKKILVLLGTFLTVHFCCAQSTDSSKLDSAKTNYDNLIFTKVDVEAGFPGGIPAWTKFAQEHIRYPRDLAYARKGRYQVIIRFIVGRDGTTSNIVAETNHGFNMEKEAIRVIKKSPKWIPATQNGVKVNAYRRQPITFVVE